jgi:hypothetical protein
LLSSINNIPNWLWQLTRSTLLVTL